jgi:hypothetical protein
MADVIDYVSRRDPSQSDLPKWSTLMIRAAIVFASAMLVIAGGGRVIPGGPFISIHADVIPGAACCFVIAKQFRFLRRFSAERQAFSVLLILAAAAILFYVVADVVGFAMRPYARGDLIRW